MDRLIPKIAPNAAATLVCVATAAALASGCSADRGPDEMMRSSLAWTRLIPTLDSLRIDAKIPGLAVAVLYESEVVALTGFGYADVEEEILVGPDTPFNIASVTKPISATVALRLREQTHFDLDTPMRSFDGFSDLCTEAKAAGGIFFDDWACEDPNLTLRHVLSMTADGRPGERFFYNPVSYSWASRPLAQVADQSFSDLTQELVLTPAGMTSSARIHRDLPLRADLANDLATPYHLAENGTLQISEPPGPQGDGAAGGIISTARDLAAFDAALDRGELLTASDREEMWTAAGPEIPYGLGWFVSEVDGEPVLWHTGLWEGAYSALYLKVPERRSTLILLANSDGLMWESRLDEAELGRSPFARAFLDAVRKRDAS